MDHQCYKDTSATDPYVTGEIISTTSVADAAECSSNCEADTLCLSAHYMIATLDCVKYNVPSFVQTAPTNPFTKSTTHICIMKVPTPSLNENGACKQVVGGVF